MVNFEIVATSEELMDFAFVTLTKHELALELETRKSILCFFLA